MILLKIHFEYHLSYYMISWSRRLNWAICLIVSVDKIVGGTAVFKLLLNKLKLIDILTNNLKIKF